MGSVRRDRPHTLGADIDLRAPLFLGLLERWRRQVWAAVAWQTTLTLLIAVLVGAPLGVAAGRVGWRGFADSLGVVPFTEIPLLTLIAGLPALVVAANLLASVPAAIAARTRAQVTCVW
jgi:hypothetical protein